MPLLLEVMRGERDPLACSAEEWTLLVQQARRGRLLAELACRLDPDDEGLPEGARHALRWARAARANQDQALAWDLRLILEALARHGIPVILLKGMAYQVGGFAFARARLFSDIDILVPEESLEAAEGALFLAGYVQSKTDPYDRRYYREWMHELPPLQHVRRGTQLDVHHNIAPPTSRYVVPAQRLWEAAVPVETEAGRGGNVLRLGDEDLVLHTALHLYTESEFFHGLRDLMDLVGLLEEFAGRRPGFLDALVARAEALDLARPLYLAARHAAQLLDDARSRELAARLESAAPPLASLYDACFVRALLPAHPSCEDAFTGTARWLLYVRGHWLRMPLHLLLPHLARKAWKGLKSEPA